MEDDISLETSKKNKKLYSAMNRSPKLYSDNFKNIFLGWEHGKEFRLSINRISKTALICATSIVAHTTFTYHSIMRHI